MISHIMAIGKSFRMQRTEAFNELTPYGTMSKMKKDRKRRQELCDLGLYRACQIGDVKMAQVWLTRGGIVNTRNYDAQDRTPLHVSVIGNTAQHTMLVRLLLSKDADPTIEDETGKCVLDWAPRARATAQLLEPLKRARKNGERVTKTPRQDHIPGRDEMSQGSVAEDDFEIVDEDELDRRRRNRSQLVASSYGSPRNTPNLSMMTKEKMGMLSGSPPRSGSHSGEASPSPSSTPRCLGALTPNKPHRAPHRPQTPRSRPGTPRCTAEPELGLNEVKGTQLRAANPKPHTPKGRSSSRLQSGSNSGRASKVIGYAKPEPKYTPDNFNDGTT
eukprot:TRINITY_DN8434_c0_g2_i4.p1 TRINITY_DN8434_c0_g2~~TRINITY_DN8434_c0_g2_i4.p1  ORF type:complete len:331 (-),score=63.94 TRINITY_DN8434_c0_g2_i4:280-1272(-)